mgnify:CR=1 FL=1
MAESGPKRLIEGQVDTSRCVTRVQSQSTGLMKVPSQPHKMIQNSFVILDKVNNKTEQNLWNQGIINWDSFLNKRSIKGISGIRKSYYNRQLLKARHELFNQNSSYFIDKLSLAETWRLYDFFKEEAVFLDIETSGLSRYDSITVFGMYDGIDTKMMIRGINFDYKAIKEELKKYKLIVTFNGATFDLPFIRKRFPDLMPNIPHIDLRTACARAGLTGGLKNIEKELGIRRRKLVEDMYGGDALTLWRMYRGSGDKHYLNLLVEYNEEDIINLKTIANFVCNNLKQKMKDELQQDTAA